MADLIKIITEESKRMRRAQPTKGDSLALLANTIAGVEKMTQVTEKPYNTLAMNVVNQQLRSNIYNKNLKDRKRESDIQSGKQKIIMAQTLNISEPNIDNNKLDEMEASLDKIDVGDDEVLQLSKDLEHEKIAKKRQWVEDRDEFLHGTDKEPGLYDTLDLLEDLHKTDYESGQLDFSNVDNTEVYGQSDLKGLVEDVLNRFQDAKEMGYQKDISNVEARIDDLSRYITLRDELKQIDSVVEVDPTTGKKDYGKFDMPEQLIELSDELKLRISDEEGFTAGTYDDLLKESMRRMQSGNIDKAEKFFDYASMARNTQIKETIDDIKQDKENQLAVFADAKQLKVEDWSKNYNTKADFVNNLITTMKADDAASGLIKIPTISVTASAHKGQEEQIATAMMQTIGRYENIANLPGGGGIEIIKRWKKRGNRTDDAVMIIDAMSKGKKTIKLKGEKNPISIINFMDDKNIKGRLDWKGTGVKESTGDTYWRALMDLYKHTKNKDSLTSVGGSSITLDPNLINSAIDASKVE